MRNNGVMTCQNIEVFQEIVFPSSKRGNGIKNAGRTIGFHRKICFTCPNCDLYFTIQDERHRDEVIGDGTRTGFCRKSESIAPCIHNQMVQMCGLG